MLSETTKALKKKYLENKDIFDSKREKLTKRNDEIYPEFIKNQRKLIRNRSKDTFN